MRSIKIRRGGILEKWHTIRHLLPRRTIKHPRAPWLCFPPHVSKKPHWYLRKQKRRYLRRMKKVEAMWAKYKKPTRLNDRQLAQLKERVFQSELERQSKITAPFYRIMRKNFLIGLNCFHATKRKFAVKRSVLRYHRKNQKIYNYQREYLNSSTIEHAVFKDVQYIGALLKQKMQLDKAFKDMLLLREVIKRRLIDKRKYFFSVLLPLAEYYHSIRIFKHQTVPKYFRQMEKLVYHERNIIEPAQPVFNEYLKCARYLATSIMGLRHAFDEMKMCLKKKWFFTNEVTKVENRLCYGKIIILQLLRSGHEVLTDLFFYYSAYNKTEYLRSKYTTLAERRDETYSKRLHLELEVQQLLQRHRSHRETRLCPSYLPNVVLKQYSKKELAKILSSLHKDHKIFYGRKYLDDVKNKNTDQEWTTNSLKVIRILAEKIYMDYKSISLRTSDENNRTLYFELREQSFRDRIDQVFNLGSQCIINRWISYTKHRRRRPRVYIADNRALNKYFRGLEDRRNFQGAMKTIFNYTKRRSTYKGEKLGTYHKMLDGNKDVCVKAEFKFFRMFLMIKHSIAGFFTRHRRFRQIQKQDDIKSREFVLKHAFMGVNTGLKKQTINKFEVEKFRCITICPLCLLADRRLRVRKGEAEDWFEETNELEREGVQLILGTKKKDYLHYIDQCPQPEALYVIRLAVLKDRRNINFKDDQAWMKYD